VQRATAQSKTRMIGGYGVAEALPGFQAGFLTVCIFSLFCSFCLLIWAVALRTMQNKVLVISNCAVT
jgi:hypothetical protein